MKKNAFTHAYLIITTLVTLLAAPCWAEEAEPDSEPASRVIIPSLDPPIDQLRAKVGESAEVTFTVMAVGGRSNLYLNSQVEWRSSDCFTAMLAPEARQELKQFGTDEPFDDLIGRKVRCRGKLELEQDRVRIVVRDLAKQLDLLGPDGEPEEPAASSVATTDAATATASANAQAIVPADKNTPYVQPSIEELRASVSKESVVTFRVLNAGGRSHLYINSQRDYRRSDCFTAQVDPSAVASLTELGLQEPSTEIVGKLLECRGTVQQSDGRVSIVVTDVKKQLRILDESSLQPAAESQATEAAPKTP